MEPLPTPCPAEQIPDATAVDGTGEAVPSGGTALREPKADA